MPTVEPGSAGQTYCFTRVEACDMCRAPREGFRMLGMRLNGSQSFSPARAEGIAVSVKQCTCCELIFSDPQPRPASLSDHYGVAPEDYWVENYFDPREGHFAEEIAALKELVEPGARVLDVGAGIGKTMTALSQAGFDTFGLEPSEPFHRAAVERAGIDPGRLVMQTLEDAEFPADHFDAITFGAVLEHLYSPSAALERAFGWLKPNGIIHVEVPSSRHLIARLINGFFRLRGTNYVTHISPMHVPFHLYEFGLESFARNGELLGYEVARHQFRVCEIFKFPKLVHPPLRWWMERTGTGMQIRLFLRKK